MKTVLESVVPLKPEFICPGGDLKIASVISDIDWEGPEPILTSDLAHLVENFGKNILEKNNIFKEVNINGDRRGIGNENRKIVVDHFKCLL